MKKFKIVYTAASVKQIKHIAFWYESKSKGLGKRFKENLKEELSLARKNPLSRSFRYDDVRFAVVKNFPYAAIILSMSRRVS